MFLVGDRTKWKGAEVGFKVTVTPDESSAKPVSAAAPSPPPKMVPSSARNMNTKESAAKAIIQAQKMPAISEKVEEEDKVSNQQPVTVIASARSGSRAASMTIEDVKEDEIEEAEAAGLPIFQVTKEIEDEIQERVNEAIAKIREERQPKLDMQQRQIEKYRKMREEL